MILIGIAVSAVPEGLPAAMSVILALGIGRMAPRGEIGSESHPSLFPVGPTIPAPAAFALCRPRSPGVAVPGKVVDRQCIRSSGPTGPAPPLRPPKSMERR